MVPPFASAQRQNRSVARRQTHPKRLMRRQAFIELLENRRLLAADYGDAPLPYPTLISDGGAAHAVAEIGPYLGFNRPDYEEDGIPDANGLGDDTNELDDEDGLELSSDVLIPGNNTRLFLRQGRVAGVLNAWIDFNRDGDWDDSGEQIATNVAMGDQGFVQAIDFTVPETAISGFTFGRFRISTDSDLGPTGMASDGEVEDHRFVISSLDFGDAPDAYGTTFASDGARHALVRRSDELGMSTFALGNSVDPEVDGNPTPNADGDDNTGIDDEDGISGLDQPLIQGTDHEIGISVTLPVDITTPTLTGWIDFNHDGDFNDQGENALFEFIFPNTTSAVLSIPDDALSGTTIARFRLTTETAIGPTGLAMDGEVEDYIVTIGEAACSLQVTTTDDSLDPGTLRSAILCANATPNIDRDGDLIPDPDPISFNIPGGGPHTIEPLSELPTITDAIHFDGTTQPGFAGVPLIEINGRLAGTGSVGTGANAFVFVGGAGGSIVESLVINRFTGRAIEIADATGGHIITGNYIGTDVTGAIAAANGGPDLSGSVWIGDTADGNMISENVISGNHNIGMLIGSDGNTIRANYIGTDVGGTIDVGNGADGVMLLGSDNLVRDNLISGNDDNGLVIQEGGERNVVYGNLIGTDVTAGVDLGNSSRGVLLNGANNDIGSERVSDRNIISGNDSVGILVVSSDNWIAGNYIGTDISGTTAIPNFNGIAVQGSNNIIGVDPDGEGRGNLISGNMATGVDFSGPIATLNRLAGNTIGTDVTGTVALGNGSFGVFISDESSANTIGGNHGGIGNLISGNTGGGIGMQGIGVTGNVVQGNRIGTNAAGTQTIGNGGTGVLVIGTGNTIGGPSEAAGNVIAGNINGIEIVRSDNLVQHNWIGTDLSGTIDLGNLGPGVFLNDGSGNLVLENVIAFNGIFGGGTGVASLSRAAGNPILSNSIYSNEGLGIDLGGDGVTPNDEDDPDTGANNLQNYPVLASAISSGVTTTITGMLNSLSESNFLIQFFTNDVVDPSGFGEGKTFVGQTQVTTNADGDAMIDFDSSVPLVTGAFVTATATLLGAQSFVETSEFSAAIPVVAIGPLIEATKVDYLAVDQNEDGKAGPDDVIGYTIRIGNRGDLDASEVRLEDTPDPNTTLLPDSVYATPIAVDDHYSAEADYTLIVDAAGGLLANDFDVDGLEPGTNADLTIMIDSIMRVGGDVTGVLEVASDGSFRYVADDESGSEVFAYNIVDADSLNAVVSGFVAIQVRDDNPPASMLLAAESTIEPTSTLVFSIPVIPPGKVVEIGFEARVNTDLPPGLMQVSNQGMISGSNFTELLTDDPDTPEFGDATVTPVVVPAIPEADLSLIKSSDSLSPAVGEDVTFTVQVQNAGPDPATGVTVTDKLPEGLALVTSSPSIGDYDALSGVWTIGQIAPNASVSLQLVAQVLVGQSITNVAEVTTSDQFDPNSTPGNGVESEDDQDSVVIGQCLTAGPLTVGANRFTYSCVTPGGFAKFLVGTQFGETFIERWGVTVDIANPVQAAIGVGNSEGIAQALIHLTEEQLAHDLIFQAYEMTPGPKASNTLSFLGTESRLDINQDGGVTALDALLIINRLSSQANSFASGEMAAASSLTRLMNYDANGDGTVSALDALQVINYLGRNSGSAGLERESAAATDVVLTSLFESSSKLDDELDDELLRLLIDDFASVA